MIVGRGDIAQALIEGGIDREDVTFFACGVSDSSEERESEYDRELVELKKCSTLKHIVYFSSLSIYYSDSIYARRKMLAEAITKNYFHARATIVRIGNITWGSNPNTIINYFKNCYSIGIQPELKDTYRYLIRKDEFIHWMKMIPVGVYNQMNITGEMVHVKEIWRRVQNGQY